MNNNSTQPLLDNRSSRFPHRLLRWADGPPPTIPPLRWLHSLTRIALIVLREMELNYLNLRTGALTYALLLSMVPLLAMSTAVVKGLGGGDQLRDIVFSYIDTLEQTAPTVIAGPDQQATTQLSPPTSTSADPPPANEPAADLTGHLRAAAARLFDYVDRTSFATLGTFGILGVFLSVILVLSQIEAAMNTIWHVENSRSLLRKIADYLTLMVLLPIAINVALAAGTVLTSKSLSGHLDRIIPAAWMQSLLLGGIPILFLTVALYVAYIFFPNTKVKTVPTLIGALLAGTLWFATQNLFIGLQVGVANYNAIYGSFATIPLFLVWIYFGWLFVLLGAEVAYAIQHRSSYALQERPSDGVQQLSAAFDICATVAGRFEDGRGTTIDDLAAASPCYRRDLLTATVDRLVAAGLLHHSGETGALMPSAPPGSIDHRRLINVIFGSSPPDTTGGRRTAEVIAAAQAGPQHRDPAESGDTPTDDYRTDQSSAPPSISPP
ncbi:MAG: YihY/virulence factor BrkB family protein [Desulfofustis sp.]|nr:YihY/virulence factor BrkB family protein [Desulfofustis sp.]